MAFLLRGPTVRELEARLRPLHPRLRVAVAAACVEQVLPIFETMKDDGGDELREAIALAKRYADGEAVTPDEIGSALSRVHEVIPTFDEEYDPETPTRMARSVGDAVEGVLRAADEQAGSPVDRAAKAIRDAYEAVARFVDYDDLDEADAAEEQEWQERILRQAEAAAKPPVDVARHDPRWLVQLKDEWGWEPRPAR
jgi:hypothetical protein